jgi:hypothetical protein
MTRSTFPRRRRSSWWRASAPGVLTFLTQALCFPAPANNLWRGLDIPSSLRRERLGQGLGGRMTISGTLFQ